MTVLELRFPAGRYHATPWGRHVNEGAVEWPPAPWRIVRALLATWYLKAREIPEETVRSLMNALSQLPTFRLPRASTSHTRHYLPFNEGKNEKTTKVFDTFIQLPEDGAILVAWDAALPPAELDALRILAHRIGYFGRAESLVEARVLDGIAAIEANAAPLAEGTSLPQRTELVRLLAPMLPTTYDEWRGNFMVKAEAALGPKPTAAQKNKRPKLPDDLFAALHADTGDLQAAGWNLPPGGAFVNYTRPENAFAPAPRPRPQRKGELPTVARFALTSVVPPSITKALIVGEQIHKVLCSEGISNGHAIFTGAGSEGHQHAHIFCESVDSNNAHITHITIFAPCGFDNEAVEALRRIGWTWGFKNHELRLVLHAIGKREDFPKCPLFATASKWRSLTPFVPTRHAKTYRDGRPKIAPNGKQDGSVEHDVLRLLEKQHPKEFAKVEEVSAANKSDMPYKIGHRRFRSLQFQTQRKHGEGRRGNGSGSALTITFTEPVTGPLALGYGAHFGLGLFIPADPT